MASGGANNILVTNVSVEAIAATSRELAGLTASGLRYPPRPEDDVSRSVLPREAEAAFYADPLAPKLRIEEAWCAPAWPQGEPEWLRFYKKDAAAREAAQKHSWTARLRVLLPDALSAPAAARREAMWQRMAAQRLDGEYDEAVPFDVLQEELERLCQRRPRMSFGNICMKH